MTTIGKDTLCHIGEVNKKVMAIQIVDEHYQSVNYERKYELYFPHTKQEYESFFNPLNLLKFDPGYGTKHYSGTIWFTDGTWSTREEYDGMEWWRHHERPPLPQKSDDSP